MKTRLRVMALLAVAGLLCLPLAAQQAGGEAGKKKAEKPAAQKAEKKPVAGGMPMAKPSAEMDKLTKMMLGRWTTSEKFEVSEFMPSGGSGQGEARIYRGPGGLSLIEEYRSTGPMGRFRGHGVIWWNPKAQAYNGVWCDNATPGGCETQGETKWEGEQLAGNAVSEAMGKKINVHSVYTDIKPDSFTVNMETSTEGGPMKPAFSITYTRASEKAEAKQ